MKKRTLIILILLSILANLDLSAKPRKGHYLIRGVMYVNSDSIYRNKLFLINGKEIYTDSLGNFEVKILWESVDKFGAFFWQVRREEKKLNPKYIVFKTDNKEKSVKNKWKKYIRKRFIDGKRGVELIFFWKSSTAQVIIKN